MRRESAASEEKPTETHHAGTAASVSAAAGTFATASVSVPAGNGFGGGTSYYPTDTSQGTFG